MLRMEETFDYFYITAVSYKEVFDEMLRYFAKYNPLVILWGRMPANVIKKNKYAEVKSNLFRRIFFKEHHYLINSKNVENFIESLSGIDFFAFSYGISIDNENIVLAKSPYDININASKRISSSMLIAFLGKLKERGIINKYEKLIEDE